MLAVMLVAQITVLSAGPPLSPAEAARVLRAARSDRDVTDVRLSEPPGLPLPPVRSTWLPGDGPFGPFDGRLTRLDLLRRGSDRWVHVGYDARGRSHASSFPAILSNRSRAMTSMGLVHSGGGRPALDPRIVIPLPRGYRGVPLTSTLVGRR